jgi:hypothetical protein
MLPIIGELKAGWFIYCGMPLGQAEYLIPGVVFAVKMST